VESNQFLAAAPNLEMHFPTCGAICILERRCSPKWLERTCLSLCDTKLSWTISDLNQITLFINVRLHASTSSWKTLHSRKTWRNWQFDPMGPQIWLSMFVHVYILAPKKDQSRLTPIWLEEEDIQMLPMEVRDAHQKGETVWDLRLSSRPWTGRKGNQTEPMTRKGSVSSKCMLRRNWSNL